MRSLEREQATSTTRSQLRELHEQERALQAQIATLSAALSPDVPPLAKGRVLPSVRPRRGPKPWYRSLGCLIVLLLVFPPAWALMLLTDQEQKRGVKLFALAVLAVYAVAILWTGVRGNG
jgi:hypothetical protein